MKLRTLLGCAILLFSQAVWAGEFPVTITDVAGRTVTIEHQPKYVALSTGLVFPLLTILYQNQAVHHLVAWRNDMAINAPSMYRYYLSIFPKLADVPQIGQIKSGGFDLAKFLAIKPRPNVFLLDISDIRPAKADGMIALLNKAGIKVIAVDFRHDPIQNTLRSILTVGKALGREKQAQAFVEYYRHHLQEILSTIAHANLPRPRVFLERDAGYTPNVYRTFGNGNMGAFLTLLHADNVALPLLHGLFTASVSPARIIEANPTDYIMQTAGWIDHHGQVLGGVPLGYSPNWAAIRQANAHLLKRDWFPALGAYQNRRVYSIYMPLYNSPYNLTAIEFFAKWLYPSLFADLKPNQSFITMNRRFADENVKGIFGLRNLQGQS